MQRIGLLNGENITYDKDITASTLASLTPGVISGLGITGSGASASIDAGKALVSVSRTNGDTVMVVFESTASVPVNMTGTKKVYIEVTQSSIDDGINNAENGVGIAEIKTGTDYPTANYLPLYSVTSGTVTDARPSVKSKVMRQGLPASSISYADASGVEQTTPLGTAGQYATPNGTGGMVFVDIPAASIGTMPPLTTVSGSDETLVRHSGVEYKATIQNAIRGNYETYTAGEAIGARVPVACLSYDNSVLPITGISGSISLATSLQLTENKNVIVYYNGSAFSAVVAQKTGTSLFNSTTTLGTAYNIGFHTNFRYCARVIDSSRIVVLFHNPYAYQEVYHIVLSISGSTITAGTQTLSAMGQYRGLSFELVTAGRILVSANNYYTTKTEMWYADISGTSLTLGGLVSFSPSVGFSDTYYTTLSASMASSGIVLFSRYYLDNVYLIAAKISGNTITYGSYINVGASSGHSLIQGVGDTVVVTVSNGTSSNTSYLISCNTTTLALSNIYSYTHTDTGSLIYNFFVRYPSSGGNIIYVNIGTNFVKLAVTSTSISRLSAINLYVFGGASEASISIYTGNVFNTFFVQVGSKYAYVIEPFSGALYVKGNGKTIEESRTIGFSRSAVSAGDTTLSLEHSQAITGFSGLTPGADYYLQDAGGIGLSPGSVSKIVGRAVSATTLLPIL